MTVAEILAEGKTKRVYAAPGEPSMVILEAKNDITAGDGAKHDVIPGKAEWATLTTCNVFRLLKRKRTSLPLAFVDQVGTNRFKAHRCTMLPFEVVARREAHGSYLKRHPEVEKGEFFHKLKKEFYLKTTGRRFGQYGFPTDDPLLEYISHERLAYVYHPGMPMSETSLLARIPIHEIVNDPDPASLFEEMANYAMIAFRAIEDEWEELSCRLIDFKVEFGLDPAGQLFLADVIDNDSWRLMEDDKHLDKQLYRDGRPLEEVTAAYEKVAKLTSRFK